LAGKVKQSLAFCAEIALVSKLSLSISDQHLKKNNMEMGRLEMLLMKPCALFS
jgi:hypothetical protein